MVFFFGICGGGGGGGGDGGVVVGGVMGVEARNAVPVLTAHQHSLQTVLLSLPLLPPADYKDTLQLSARPDSSGGPSSRPPHHSTAGSLLAGQQGWSESKCEGVTNRCT